MPRLKNSLYPPGATNANWFNLFNAVAFQITLGSPMILYAKSLGATATVLGIIGALTPLLTIAQIPAARFLANVGYRTFTFRGWGLRTLMVFALAIVPLLTFLDDLGRIALVLFLLFLFNLLRGISSGAWLPWMAELIPENVRGRFLSRDQLFQQVGSLSALIISAGLLRGKAEPWQFSIVFLVSALGGAASLLFLLRIPDIVAREQLVASGTPVPWRAIVSYPPFLRLTIFMLLWVLTVGAVGVFNVAFLKTKIGYSESRILCLSSLFFAGAIFTLPFVGRLLDRSGSKIVLQSALVITIVYHAIIWLISAQVLPASLPLFCLITFVNGMASANFTLAQLRLAMNTMPSKGRSHFFAFFTVITSLGLALSPIVWGLVIDAIGEWEYRARGFDWNRFSVFYFSVLLLLGVVIVFSVALHEKGSGPGPLDQRAAIFRGNLRRLLRLGPR